MTGLDINFTPNPNNGNLLILNDTQSIKQRLKSLVKTSFYERKFWPTLGCQVNNLLFENYSKILTEYIARKTILNAIEYQEPRVKEVKVIVQYRDGEDSLEITVEYQKVEENIRETVQIIIDRLR